MLLVIDNCEHVAAADAIEKLLHDCPNLRVLASSRAALGIPGEWRIDLHPLDTHGPQSTASKLFQNLVVEMGGRLDLTDRLDVVSRICVHLDGIPLAIELAAARLRSMSPEELMDRLSDRFRMLKSARAEDDRQRTLHATIDWSYQLLDRDSRLLIQRLSVFAGSFTLFKSVWMARSCMKVRFGVQVG